TVRVDLQQDMLHLQLLRTYPLSGAAIVAAEIGSTVLILCTFQALLAAGSAIAALAALSSSSTARTLEVALRAWPMVVGGAIVLPAVTALRGAVANGWAVLFPGWVQLGPTRTAGIEAIGANMLTVFGSMLAHLMLLVLPGAAAFATFYAAGVAF